MDVRELLKFHTWPDLAIEAMLRLRRNGGVTPAPSWSVPSGLRSRMKVRWPRTYQWQPMRRWGDQILDMLARRVDVTIDDVPQNYKGTVQCESDVDGKRFKVAFNISDYPDFIDDECTRESLVTFKFQFREQGYGERNVVPGGYLPGSLLLYRMLDYLRWSKDHRRAKFDVYGRFGMEFSPDIRGEALRHVAGAGALRFYGGGGLVRYSRYLREVARSRVCLDLPGEGPLCFRLADYLAIGSCIVAYRHGVVLPASLVDGVHVAYWSDGPKAMVERCQQLLADPAQQQAMSDAARSFFDRYLHRDQLSAYYVNTMLAAADVS